ncbi:WD40 repeat-like protein [Rhizoctonia solani]|uniref:WD40 repeat-like protein n=1 Tax=Rhizoctonia solani TaxID=456999 RepID=A0A8H7ICA5_9AGAM|nr:WD40 repeat-like protein [Rhizoctonia solani]
MFSKGGTLRSIVHLHDIEKSIVEEDIKKYLTDALSSMSPPPSLNDIEVLAKRSRNLFIYAATVVRYIYPGDIHVDSSARLEAMLEAISTSGPVAENRYEDLDLLYTTVLSAVFHARLSAREKDNMRRVLWTAVCAKEPITAPTIASLTNLPEHQVRVPLQSLRSVVHVPENSALISTLHASFPEYMLDQSRSKGFWCDSSQSNEIMARRCFGVMQAELRFNMCNLQNSYLEDDQVQDLQSRVSKFISPALSYASSVLEREHQLCSKHKAGYRNWIKRRTKYKNKSLMRATLPLGSPPTHALEALPHLYLGSPALRQVKLGVSALLKAHARACECCHGQRDDAALAIWNTESMTTRNRCAIVAGPFKGHESSVFCVAFSPDGTHLASGSYDNTVIIWNTHSGSIVLVHSKGIPIMYGVAFSPDGYRIVSGSDDKSVIVWEASSGRITLGPLQGHTDTVLVGYSSDASTIMSGSYDGTSDCGKHTMEP